MQISIAQITTDPGRIEQNTEKIIKYIAHARSAGSKLVVFPELALTGYACLDLFYRKDLLDQTARAIEQICAKTKGICAIIGHPLRDGNHMRAGGRPAVLNAATVMCDRKVIGVQAKQLLPNYEIFSEERYFVPGSESRVFTVFGEKIGVQICEDLWDAEYDSKVSRSLISQGAQTIVNLSASPFEPGKFAARQERIAALYKTQGFRGWFVYANLIGSFDGYDGEVVFDGRSTVHDPKGKLVALGASFTEDLFAINASAKKKVPFPALKFKIDPVQETHDALVLGIKEFFRRLGMKKAFVGLSGGIDSAVVVALAVAALGKENVVGVTMPWKVTSQGTLDDALKVARNLGIRCDDRPIGEEMVAWRKSFLRAMGHEPAGLTVQNKQARIRGATLMEYANEVAGGVVLATGNKTELATGYCTLYGDMCGALAVIGDVGKMRVYEVARYINKRARKEVVPVSTITRVPTAELAEGQEDRQNLPADYPVLAPLVDRVVEFGESVEEVLKWAGSVKGLRVKRAVVERVVMLVNRNEFKRRQAAPGIRVSSHAFGVGRRVPMG